MNKLSLEAPLNRVSFGQVVFGLVEASRSLGVDLSFIPDGKIDLSSFDITQERLDYIQESAKKSFAHDRNEPVVKFWHINGLNRSYSDKRIGFTFHETDRLTPTEAKILNQMDLVIVTSDYTKQVFESSSKARVEVVPLGFDSVHFSQLEKNKTLKDKIVFGLVGKLEDRKATTRIINLWAKTFGNNPRYLLNAFVSNVHLTNDDYKNQILGALEGKVYSNINFLPFMAKNSEFNIAINSIDIDLSGMSLAEGWNLPAFQAIALGQQAIVLNAHAHKMYANENNAILVEPNDNKIEANDGKFFIKGGLFNQGYWHDFNNDDLIEAMKLAAERGKVVNVDGIKLQKDFTYEKTVEKILSLVNSL